MSDAKRRCFICDGTGLMCDVCGESEAACDCGEDGGDLPAYSDCENCKGTGIAPADMDK